MWNCMVLTLNSIWRYLVVERYSRVTVDPLFYPTIRRYVYYYRGRKYIKYVAKELVKHPTFKSDLVIGLACFDYGVLFKLPKTVRVDCYQHLFQSFSSRGWVAWELRNVHIDDYIELVDDVRHVYLDELGVGPCVEDMVSFLSSCPELSRRGYTWDVFKLSCLCLGHVAPK